MSQSNEHAAPATEGPSYDDVNTPVIVVIGVISAIVTLLTIMLVQGMCYHLQNSYLKQRTTEVVAMPSRVIMDQQKAAIVSGEGITPIAEAIKQVVLTYNK